MTLLILPLPLQHNIKQLLTNDRFIDAKLLRDTWLQVESNIHTTLPLENSTYQSVLPSLPEEGQLCMQ